MSEIKDKKKPLCKFKEKCPDWLAKKNCGFDHVICKYNQTCKDRQACRFYHMQKPTFDKPKSQTLCSYNERCKKPGCPFKHQKPPQQSRQSISPDQRNRGQSNPRPQLGNQQKICRFDPTCIRQNCFFKHPQRDAQNQQNNAGNNQPKKQQTQQMRFETENNVVGSQSSSRGLQNNFCINFLLGKNCENGQKCGKSHEFTEKASVKRIFFSNDIPERDFNVLFYEHKKEQENKQLIYVFQEKQSISFRKMISSQNLYKDFGGIGSNQTNKTYLRSVTNQLFKAENIINGIHAFTYNQNEYLVYLAGMNIQIYNTTKGEVDAFSTLREGNKITGFALISQKAVLLVATQQLGVKKFDFNPSRQKFQERPFIEMSDGLKKFKMTDNQVLGQKVIYGVTNTNELILVNTDFKIMSIPFGNGAIVNDVDVCLINNKVPVALVSVSYGGRQHQVVAINLLNMEKQIIMLYEFSAGLDKIFTVENHLMIEVKNKGLLVYKLNQFQKQIGLIPFLNQIQEVRKDNKGNLLILEKTSASSKGSISIFKVKRI